MFDFFKKSRAFKFLCSACLLCSLGSFVTSAEGESTSDELTSNVSVKIGDAYLQAPLGSTSNRIALYNAKIDSNTGLMNDGTLKYYTAATEDRYSKGNDTNKTLDEAWNETMNIQNVNENPDEYLTIFENLGNTFEDTLLQMGYMADSNYVKFPDGTIENTTSYAHSWTLMFNHFYYTSDKTTRETMVKIAGWTLSSIGSPENYSTLQNPDENSKLVLSIPSEDDSENNSIGVTAEIDLAGKNYSLKGAQFYESDNDDVIADESAAKLSLKPGVYPVYAILTEQGDKTLISSPTMDKVVESSEESV